MNRYQPSPATLERDLADAAALLERITPAPPPAADPLDHFNPPACCPSCGQSMPR